MTATKNAPLIICLYGATGTGKSTFINDATGASLPVGHSQQSCTAEVMIAPPFKLDGREIWLVDTPGFDDTSKKDSDVLKMIGDFMTKTYDDGQLIAGIIYMHRITDIRFGGVAKRNFHVFRALCGPNALKNLIICTNMWPSPSEQADAAHPQLESRERELSTDPNFFQPAIEKGARVTRYMRHKGATHARDIIRQCLANIPVATQYQEEVYRGATLRETSAGRALDEEMQKLVENLKSEITQLKQVHEEAIRKKDEETRKEIAEERARVQKQLDALNKTIRNLNEQMERREDARLEYEARRQEQDKKIEELEVKIKKLQGKLEKETDPKVIGGLKKGIKKCSDERARTERSWWDWFRLWLGGK